MDKDQGRRHLTRLHALESVRTRMEQNDDRWGVDRVLSAALWNAVLLEEVGEVSHNLHVLGVDEPTGKLRAELVDLSAVAIAMIEAIDEGRWRPTSVVSENAALASATIVACALGSYTKDVLQRRDERTILRSLNDLSFVVNNAVSELLAVGYTPRAIEGELDEAAVIEKEQPA